MLNKINKRILREGKIIAISLATGIVLAVSVAAYTYVYSQTTQRDIADNVIRFHVRANSDSAIDLQLKEQVRLEVLAEFEEILSESTCIKATRTMLTKKLNDMQVHAEGIVRSAGFNYPVTAGISRMFFPTKFYGNMSFPPGEYEAVKIIIGEGAGSNWWCLMFPPLCYVDMTATESGRQQLANTVTEEGFRLLMHQEEQRPGLVVRFRVVEWWQNRGQPATAPGQNFIRR